MVIARPIQGKHRTIKTRINLVLFGLFAIVPYVRVGGHPLLLLDIPARKFHIFGLTIWPQELYFLHLLLMLSGVMLFFFTSLLGRIWCGYGCPQTIFTEFYDAVGKLVVGSSFGKTALTGNQKIRLYIAWFIVAFALSFQFLAFFVPYEEIWHDILRGEFFPYLTTSSAVFRFVPAPWIIFLILSTGFAMFNVGYFRENVCKLVCPYGRFQTALLDSHSPIVHYDAIRGEPRREKGQKSAVGDCVDCNMCQLVCPTGIDIRDGLQIGCIQCGLCVDACTSVLSKFKKPTLIDYRTIAQAENAAAPRKYLRPRTVVYGSLIAVLTAAFVYLLVVRIPIYAVTLRDKAISSIKVEDRFQNGYEIHVGNMSYKPIRVSIRITDDQFRILAPATEYTVPPAGFEKIRFVVEHPEPRANTFTKEINFELRDLDHENQKLKMKSIFSFRG
ncbi:MAG: cytochrome c oxidase accessory protein CcoG [Leptospirales bacterium]|nr:cytochrome c oxidase accessory protein CcoG [Leptospirales bacterium]